jgi:DNA polymerase III delta subunit
MSQEEKIRICWLTGSFYHTRIILDKIKKSIGDYELYLYDENNTPEHIEMQILGSGLFASNRLIILRGIPHFVGTSTKSNSRWTEIFSNVPEDCVVVIDNVDVSSRQVIFKHIKKIGKVFDPPKVIKKDEAISYISDLFSEKNKNILREDIDLIVSNSLTEDGKGIDVDRVTMIVKQICYFVGNKKKNIEKLDLIRSLTGNNNYIIWDMFDAIDNRDFIKCEELLYSASEVSSIKGAIEELFRMLLWRFRLMFFLKEGLSLGRSQKEIFDGLKNIHKFSREGSGFYSKFSIDLDKENNEKVVYSESVANNMINGMFGKTPVLDKYSRTEVFKIMRIIEECLFKIRNISNEIEYLIVADSFFMFICGTVDENLLSKLRRIANE